MAKKKAVAQDDPHAMFALPNMDDGRKPAAEEKKPPTMEDLLKRLDEQDAAMRTLKDDYAAQRRANVALMQAAPAPQQQVQHQPQAEAKMPDPQEDPTGWARAIEARAEAKADAKINALTRQQKESQQISQKVEGLWSDFAERYPDWADQEELVEFATDKVVKAAARRGVDVERYMFGATDLFFEDVMKEMKKIRPEPKADDDDGDGDGDEDTGRSAAMLGGVESGGRPTKGNSGEPPAGSDMISQLHEIQRKSGIF